MNAFSETNNPSHIDHIAIAVPSLDDAIKKFSALLGVKAPKIETLEDHGVKIAIFQLAGTKIELMEPINSLSPISKFLLKNPRGGIHHISLESSDIDQIIKRSDIPEIGKRQKGATGKSVTFLDPKKLGILVELQETFKQKTFKKE